MPNVQHLWSYTAAAALAACLPLLVPLPAQAQADYTAQVVMRAGDLASDVPIPAGASFQVGDLNDNGHVTAVAGDRSSGMLLQFAGGRLTAIVAPGLPGPQGTWPSSVLIGLPVRSNADGDVVFFTESGGTLGVEHNTYHWDFARRAVTPIAQPGMTLGSGFTLVDGGYFSPVINNRDEIAFPAGLRTGTATTAYGLFFRDALGSVQPIMLPNTPIGDTGTVGHAVLPSLDDSGRVAFLSLAPGAPVRPANGAVLWERGAVSPILLSGRVLSDGRVVAAVGGAYLNDANPTVLLLAYLTSAAQGPAALFRFDRGTLATLAETGREMPGGGRLVDIPGFGEGVSWGNRSGQHAFLATLSDGTRGAYLIDAAGAISLILKEGMATNAGTVTALAPFTTFRSFTGPVAGASFGIALNNRGQVALPVQLDGSANAVLLLTPAPL